MMTKTRESYTQQASELKKQFAETPTEKGFDYAEKLFQLGDFTKAQRILKSLPDTPKAIYLTAQIEYMSGNYQEAEKLYTMLQSSEFQREAEQGLALVYYQTGQYSKAKTLSSPFASMK